MTKFKLDLHNPLMYPYTKFELRLLIHETMNGMTEWWNEG
jgi:hypothetical protein